MSRRSVESRRPEPQRLLLLLIAGLLALAIGGAAFASPASAALHADVDAALLSQYGLTQESLARVADGGNDGLFRPFDAVTRAQYAKFIVKAFGLSAVTPVTPTFGDVPADHPLSGYVEAAAAAGIVNGTGDGLFAPDRSITREEAAAILVRYLVVKNGRNLDALMTDDVVSAQLGLFKDGGTVSPSLRKEMALAVARTAMRGRETDGGFLLSPHAPLLRLQAVALALRQEKPGMVGRWTRTPSAVTGVVSGFVGSIAKSVGTSVAKGVATWGLKEIEGALGFNTVDHWAEVNQSLSDIQTSIDGVAKDVNEIQDQLNSLSTLMTQQYNAIQATQYGIQAQSAMTSIETFYSDPIALDYAYYIGLHENPPTDPAVAAREKAGLETWIRTQVLISGIGGLPYQLGSINSALLPAQGTAGVLSSWANTMCAGALTDAEVQDSFGALETYFAQLITSQMQAVQLSCETSNWVDTQDGKVPAAGQTNGPRAAGFLSNQWFPMLQEELDNYMQNVAQLAVTSARNLNEFTPDLLNDDVLDAMIARANYFCNSLEEQQVVYGAGDGLGDPQGAYGLQAVVIYPAGLKVHSGALYAHTDKALFDYPSDATENTCTLSGGPGTLLFDTSVTPATLDVTTDYTVRRLSFGTRPNKRPGAVFAIGDFGSSVQPANSYWHGDVTLNYVDDNYQVVTAPGDGVDLYGCEVVSYQYFSGNTGDSLWSVPGSLGNRWAVNSETGIDGWLTFSPSGSGRSAVGFPYQTLDLQRSIPDGKVYWSMEERLPQFTFIGPNGTQVSFRYYPEADEGNMQTDVANGQISADRGGTSSWSVVFGVRDGSNASIASKTMTAAVAGKSDALSLTMANGTAYTFYASQQASFKASHTGDYALEMGTSYAIDHVGLVLPPK